MGELSSSNCHYCCGWSYAAITQSEQNSYAEVLYKLIAQGRPGPYGLWSRKSLLADLLRWKN